MCWFIVIDIRYKCAYPIGVLANGHWIHWPRCIERFLIVNFFFIVFEHVSDLFYVLKSHFFTLLRVVQLVTDFHHFFLVFSISFLLFRIPNLTYDCVSSMHLKCIFSKCTVEIEWKQGQYPSKRKFYMKAYQNLSINIVAFTKLVGFQFNEENQSWCSADHVMDKFITNWVIYRNNHPIQQIFIWIFFFFCCFCWTR